MGVHVGVECCADKAEGTLTWRLTFRACTVSVLMCAESSHPLHCTAAELSHQRLARHQDAGLEAHTNWPSLHPPHTRLAAYPLTWLLTLSRSGPEGEQRLTPGAVLAQLGLLLGRLVPSVLLLVPIAEGCPAVCHAEPGS